MSEPKKVDIHYIRRYTIPEVQKSLNISYNEIINDVYYDSKVNRIIVDTLVEINRELSKKHD